MLLPYDMLFNICSFVSFECLIYIFPYHAHVYYDPKIYDYMWIQKICFPNDDVLRKRLLNWFIWKQIIPINSVIINYICKYNYISILEKMTQLLQKHKKNIDDYFTPTTTDIASSYGNIEVLDFIYQLFGNRMKYTTLSLDNASKNEYIIVLHWWSDKYINKGIKLLYTKNAIDNSSNVKILDFWFNMYKNYDIPMLYSTKHIDFCRNTEVLDWWLQKYQYYGLRIKYRSWSINISSGNNYLDILEWWFNQNTLTLKYDEYSIDFASKNGHIEILNRWLRKWECDKKPLKYSSFAIDIASKNNHIHILNWWLNQYIKYNFKLKYTENAINHSIKNENIQVLEWWLDKCQKYDIIFKYDRNIPKSKVIEHWWIKNHPKITFINKKILYSLE